MEQLKSRIIRRREPETLLSLAWVRELREHNKTRRVYPVDPYAEVYSFRENTFGIYTQSADGKEDVWAYLIIGPQKAMLIDTSYGIGDLRALAEQIAGCRELIVVNTHATYDHSFGNCQFEKVYCHKYAQPELEAFQSPHIWDYLFSDSGEPKWMQFDRADIVPFRRYEIVPCENHTIFNLGEDYDIELIWLPGHQAGHCAFLDRKGRNLFCGDSIKSQRIAMSGKREGLKYQEYTTVAALREELYSLSLRTAEFDRLFPGHSVTDLDSEAVGAVLSVMDHVLMKPEDYDLLDTHFRGDKVMYFKTIPGLGMLAYNKTTLGQRTEEDT